MKKLIVFLFLAITIVFGILFQNTAIKLEKNSKVEIKNYSAKTSMLNMLSRTNLLKSTTDVSSTETNYLCSTSEENSKESSFLGNESVKRENVNSVAIYSADDSFTANNSTKWNIDFSDNGEYYAWYTVKDGKYDVYMASKTGKIKANSNSSYLFANLTNCTEINGLEKIDTSSVENMSYMFYNCGKNSMTKLDVSGLNTSNVKDMSHMFQYTYVTEGTTCNIKEIIFGENFKTSNVENMSYMFSQFGRDNLTKLDISTFNTNRVTNMEKMFFGCGYYKMTKLDLGDNFDTSKVTNMNYMFQGAGNNKMERLNLGNNFNTENVTNMENMFLNCGKNSMKKLDLGESFKIIANENIFENCGKEDCSIVINKALYISQQECKLSEQSNDKITLTDKRVFEKKLKHVLADTSKETEATSGFLGSNSEGNSAEITREKINSIHIYKGGDPLPDGIYNTQKRWEVGKGWNPGNGATGTYSVYAYYKELGTGMYDIYIKPNSSWNDAKFILNEDSSYLFANLVNCTKIEGLENLDTSSVTDMNHMFYNYGYNTKQDLDVSVLDTGEVKNMSYMFGCTENNYYCKIRSITFGGKFNTSNVTNMSGMFSQFGRKELDSLDVSSFNTRNVTDMSKMFFGCGYYKMTKLNLGDSFNTGKVTNMEQMFQGAGYTLMTELNLGDGFNTNKVTNMKSMFLKCGNQKMEKLILGDAFKNIASENENMFKICGADGCIIKVNEEIYANESSCKLNKNSETIVSVDTGRHVIKIPENYLRKAIQEVAYSYYMRGEFIQYNLQKANYAEFAPEEATDQNREYMACSAFLCTVYNELFGVEIAGRGEGELITYSREHIKKNPEVIGYPEVIVYGYTDVDDVLMWFGDGRKIKNPSLEEDIIPYLKPRRCFNI